MGDDRSGRPSSLAYFAAGLDVDHLPDGEVRDSINENATAVLSIASISQGGIVPWRTEGRPTWFVDLIVAHPGPSHEFTRGTIRAGERGALRIIDPDGEDFAIMWRSEVIEVRELGILGMKVRIQAVDAE